MIYISGPMTGLAAHNYPAFFEAEYELTERGHQVLNPARHFDGDRSRTYAEYFRADVEDLLKAVGVYMLPGWENSKGAILERDLARAIGLYVHYAPGATTEKKGEDLWATT